MPLKPRLRGPTNTPRDVYVPFEGRHSKFQHIPCDIISEARALNPGENRRFGEFELARDETGRFHVVRPTYYNDYSGIETNSIVVFPHHDHEVAFHDSSKNTRRHGPSDTNPLGVGTITFRKVIQPGRRLGLDESPLITRLPVDHSKLRVLEAAQAHFVDNPAELAPSSNPMHRDGWGTPLPRDIRRQYMPWRRKAIAHMLSTLRREEAVLYVPDPLIKNPGSTENNQFGKELLSYWRKNGVGIEKTDHGFLLYP
jgi:hypothetical protein